MKKMILLIEDNTDHVDLILDVLETEDAKNEIVLMNDRQEITDFLQITDSSASPTEFGWKQAVQSDAKGDNKRYSQIDLIILDINMPKIK